jgi:methionyl-tRNA formyltransferase
VRLVFAGTPAVALPSLDALAASARHDVVAVVTRPDAPAGRGRALAPSPVSRRALQLGIQTLTPGRPSEPEFLDRLRELDPDACPVVAYGALVPPEALAIPTVGWVNLHFSLLPAWRGAAPVQRALLAGDDVTGATTFLLEAGLDTGPVFGAVTTAVAPTDTAGDLLDRLSRDGAQLLERTLDGIEDGTLTAVPQPSDGVSLAPKLSPADARVDWTTTATAVDRTIRACTPSPGAWTTFRGRRLLLLPVRPAAAPDASSLPPGRLRSLGREGVLVGTADGTVALSGLRPEGKATMAATDWVRGVRLTPDDAFE